MIVVNSVGDRYLLQEQIGQGGMGVVWLAHDGLLHREVAVKQLRLPDPRSAEAEVSRIRAMREARIAARLQHPNAISVYDVVVEDGLPWIVMEYLPSRSLSALLAERGPLAPAEAAGIGGQVAAALAAAHRAGIVHRDVKPANVLIGHDGTVKITDFGISRAVGDATLTEAGMISGTPAYLAPEVARGDSPDPRSDVFSLGATLYAMTEGHSPYGPGENTLGLIHRAASGSIDRPIRSGPLTGVLTRLLAAEPTRRPTAADAVRLLDDIAPVSAEADTLVQRADNPPKTTLRWVLPTIGLVVLLLVVLSVLEFLPPPTDAADKGQQNLPKVEQTSDQVAVAQPVFNAESVAQFVRGHYRMLGKNPRRAWENLSPANRPPVEEFERIWNQYGQLKATVVNVVAEGSGWLVDVRVKHREGDVVEDDYRVGVELTNGTPLIVSSVEL